MIRSERSLSQMLELINNGRNQMMKRKLLLTFGGSKQLVRLHDFEMKLGCKIETEFLDLISQKTSKPN